MTLSLALVLHVLAAVVWVGGMFFAHQVLRVVAAAQLEPPARLALWRGVFTRFFVWVWSAVVLLPVTGYYFLFASFGGMAATPVYVHVMNGIGLLMIALFLFLFFGPYARFKGAVDGGEWPVAAGHLATIRRIVGTNLLLGLITIAVATGGSFF